jgi:hypothetical protein
MAIFNSKLLVYQRVFPSLETMLKQGYLPGAILGEKTRTQPRLTGISVRPSVEALAAACQNLGVERLEEMMIHQ